MVEYIGKKMVVDTRAADGGVYFEKDHFTWSCRYGNPKLDIVIYYKDVCDIIIYNGEKKRVEVTTTDEKRYDFFLYKAATFVEFIKAGIEYSKNPDTTVVPINNEDLIRLQQLSELHKDGILSDEQFENQKNLIMKKYN